MPNRAAGDGASLLTIVFVNYNTTPMLNQALASLARHRPSFPVEVIVVDNSPPDGIEFKAPGPDSGLRVIRNPENRGYGGAANQGIEAARGEYVAIANTDIEFLPGTLERLVTFLRERPDAGIVAPQFLWPDLTAQPSARRYPRLSYILAGRRSPLSRILPNRRSTREFLYAGIEGQDEAVAVETAIGAFLVARREMLQALGGFSPDYFMFIEDVDLCRRVNRSGKGVYVLPPARMIHHGGAARATANASIDFVRLRSFYHYFRAEYAPRMSLPLLLLFSWYLAMLLAGRLLGIREWEYRARPVRSDGETRNAECGRPTTDPGERPCGS